MARRWQRFAPLTKHADWEECWAHRDPEEVTDYRLPSNYVVKWPGKPGYYCVRSPLEDTYDRYIVQEKFDDLEVAKTALLLLTA